MTFLYNFGLSQEDERTEAAALQLGSGDRVLSVASAGDMPLSLLALGARQVTAVDLDPNQLHLCRIKAAAVAALDRESAIRFLGFMSASHSERDQAFASVAKALPAASRTYWGRSRAAVRDGVIWAGRYERFLARAVRVVRPFLGHRLDGLFQCSDVVQQRDYFRRRLDTLALRMLFRVIFHPRVFANRGMDPQSLQHRTRDQSVAEQYYGRLRDFCTATPARLNPFLQVHFLGRVIDADAVPGYLTREGFDAARDGLDRLEFVESDLLAHLEASEAGSYDKLHLSNVPDWLPQPAFERVMGTLAGKLLPGARFIWRSLHTDYPLPAALGARVALDAELGRQLRRTDRFPFYDILPAEIRVAAGEPAG